MELQQLKEDLTFTGEKNSVNNFNIPSLGELQIYYNSVQQKNELLFFIGNKETEKNLYILFYDKDKPDFEGTLIHNKGGLSLMECPLTTRNRKTLQGIFNFAKPSPAGLRNSFGFGDRIGLGNAGHIKALNGSDFFPVLAQQSIRELTRTGRSADEVMDAAVWAVFQEGYQKGFSADGDHLKTIEDIDMLVKAGFKMFTFDPSEFVENNADVYNNEKLYEVLSSYPWNELKDSLANAKERYLDKSIVVDKDLVIKVTETDLLRAYTKYGRSLLHVNKLYKHLKTAYPDYDSEVEISVDETDSVTSVFEHYYIASELKRLEIKFVSLAPRFVGSFEKGIDYKGDLNLFEQEYKKHLSIAEYFGNYKISLHSGSDKFSVYAVIGKLKRGFVHVKTAGTSYLEALRVVALKQPNLFREILDFSRALYDNEKRTYSVSADLDKVKKGSEYSDEQLVELFSSVDVRQVLHVTFGKVLSEKNSEGSYIFKDRIKDCLKANEQVHYEVLIKHFNKHIQPFL